MATWRAAAVSGVHVDVVLAGNEPRRVADPAQCSAQCKVAGSDPFQQFVIFRSVFEMAALTMLQDDPAQVLRVLC